MTSSPNKIVNLYRLLHRSFGRYKFQIILLSILSFGSGILEGIGVNAIIPLFSFINKDQNHGADIVSKAIENFFSFFKLSYSLRTLLIFIVAVFLLKAVFLFLTKYISVLITAQYEKHTRSNVFQSTLLATWPFLSGQKIGHLDQILITDINNSSAMLSHISSAILIITNLLVYSLVVVNISPLIAFLTVVSGVIIFIFLRPFFYRTKMLFDKIAYLYKQLSHYVSQNNIGMKGIKAMSLEEPVISKGQELFENLKTLNIKTAIIKNCTAALLQPVGLIFVIGIFAFFYKIQGFNFASFAVVVYAINKLFAHVQLAESEAHSIMSLAPFVASTLRYQEDVKKHQELNAGKEPFSFQRELSFNNVCFSYPGESVSVIKNINFSILKGKMVGIIGPSGAGKTTIVDLLLRLFSLNSGSISIDDKNIDHVNLHEWRKHVGYVSQDVFLLNDTVANNIRFYDQDINEEQVRSAAETAHCLEFIEKLPQKFLTPVGERGMMLSGGQKQRIALARVLARRPDILILDEATSALDNDSEAMIQESLNNLRGKITIIAIAHRLSTISISDTLIVIDKGKIAEMGSPDQLINNRESYFFQVYNLE